MATKVTAWDVLKSLLVLELISSAILVGGLSLLFGPSFWEGAPGVKMNSAGYDLSSACLYVMSFTVFVWIVGVLGCAVWRMCRKQRDEVPESSIGHDIWWEGRDQ